MRSVNLIAMVAAAALTLAACADQKAPAEQAVAKAESALAEFHADAEKYAADDLKDVDAAVGNMKNNLARKDYGAVVMAAPSVSNSIAKLKETVEQRKTDAEQMMASAQSEWTDLSASLPKTVETLQARVDQLSKTKRFPKGMDKAAFDAARTEFENLKAEWTEASTEYTDGKMAEAVRKARTIKSQAEDLATRLEAKLG